MNSGRNAKMSKSSLVLRWLLMELKLPRYTCGLRPSEYETLTENKRRDTQSISGKLVSAEEIIG